MEMEQRRIPIQDLVPARSNRRTFLQDIASIGLCGLRPLRALGEITPTATKRRSEGEIHFRDVTDAAGIHFRHDRAASHEKLLTEIMGAGCAWLDYNQDGLLDAFFVNSGRSPQYHPITMPQPALYRNNGDGTFTDVTKEAGLTMSDGFYFGVAIGDYDNDGYPDIYMTGYDGCVLFKNNRNGTFSDVTTHSGLKNSGHWATAAGWFDYDHDGKLDLLVGNYVNYDWHADPICGRLEEGYRTYCDPFHFKSSPLRLFHNNGDGTFTDRTKAAGLSEVGAKCLGMVLADFDGDGWDDILIANDGLPTYFFINQKDGTFLDLSFESGAGFGFSGEIESGMGIDAADVGGTGRLDFFIGHMDGQLNRLYRNDGERTFTDKTFESGLSRTNWTKTSWGLSFLDWDNDGARDLLVANGSMLDNIALYHPGSKFEERRTLYRNLGDGHFSDVTDSQYEGFKAPSVGRGLAVGDFNNDGALDFIQSNNGGRAQLFMNENASHNNWITIKLEGVYCNRDAVGAKIRIVAGDLKTVDQIKGGTSYCSSQDKRLHFGLGERRIVEIIEVHWPGGSVEILHDVTPNRIIKIVEGRGIVPSKFPRF